MRPVVVRGRRVLATVGSLVLGAGLAVTLAPSAGSALPAEGGGDRPAPVLAPAGPQAKALAKEWAAGPHAKALSEAFPATLGALSYTSVYGATAVKSSTGRKLTASLSAFEAKGSKTSSFYISLSRGANEMHGWSFQAPASAFDISAKAAGKLTLAPKKTGGMGKVAVKVKPDGKMKSYTCGGGKVYAKERNVVIAGTFFFDTGSKWGKVGSKKKPFKFRTSHRVYFSYNTECPPVEYPNPCYSGLSWSTWRETANSATYVGANKDGAKSSIFAFRSTKLAKPKNAWRTDMAWGTGDAPDLTVNPDDSATMKIFGVGGSGTIADPNPGSTFDYPCDEGTQYSTSWWMGTVTNDATPVKVPAQVFGSFTVPDGSAGYMSRSWFE